MGKSLDGFLDKVPPNRRNFFQRVLGIAGFAPPMIRTFVMASSAASIVPDAFAVSNATTTRSPWRPGHQTVASPMIPSSPSLIPSLGNTQPNAGSPKPLIPPHSPQIDRKKR